MTLQRPRSIRSTPHALAGAISSQASFHTAPIRGLLLLGVLLLAGLCFADASQAATIFTVGQPETGSPSCDYSSIQAAIDAVEGLSPAQQKTAVVRVSREGDHSKQNALTFDGAYLTLEGGYADCGSSQPDGIRSLIDGNSTESVLAVISGEVLVRDLRIKDGGGSGGGGISLGAGTSALLDNVYVYENTTLHRGGGVLVERDAHLVVVDSHFVDNTSEAGGGIACTQGSVQSFGATLQGNHAFRGGGLSAESSCHVELRGAHDISSNRAQLGGGIEVRYATLEVRPGNGGTVDVHDNLAYDSPLGTGTGYRQGGGIFVVGSSAVLDAVDVKIRNNAAEAATVNGGGGGLFVGAGRATLRSSGNCADCNVLSGNRAPWAAAAYPGFNSRIELEGTRVEGQTDLAGDPTEAVFYGYSAGILRARGVLFTGNSAHTIMKLRGPQSHIDIAFSTFALNTDIDPAQAVIVAGGLYGDALDAGKVSLHASILWEYAGSPSIQLQENAEVESICVLSNDFLNAPAGAVDWFLDSPGFTSDFHLASFSAAVDRCDPAVILPAVGDPGGDMDGEQRCIERPGTGAAGVTCDLGADEVQSILLDLVFGDGFENGGLTKWSGVG